MLKKGVHFILHYCMKTRIVKWGSVSVMLSKDKDEISHTEWCVYVCVFVWWSGEGGRGIKDLCPYLYFLIMISRTAVLLLPSTCQSNGRCRREVLGLRRWSGEKGECEELWRWGGGASFMDDGQFMAHWKCVPPKMEREGRNTEQEKGLA